WRDTPHSWIRHIHIPNAKNTQPTVPRIRATKLLFFMVSSCLLLPLRRLGRRVCFFQKSVYKGRLDLLVCAHDMVLDRLVGGGRFAAGLAGPEGVARGAVVVFFRKAVGIGRAHV